VAVGDVGVGCGSGGCDGVHLQHASAPPKKIEDNRVKLGSVGHPPCVRRSYVESISGEINELPQHPVGGGGGAAANVELVLCGDGCTSGVV
jgi:hypothetical protein